MGERKVLNKYYPPDFDPAKLPRGKRQERNEMKVRMMLPMSVRCKTCGNFMYKGTKFNTRKEDVEGETYLGIQIFRFYYRCTNCAAEFTMKTDPKTSDYIMEEGASRNYEPWREADVLKAEAVRSREEEERGNAMKALENRTKDSKREMDIMEALDEMRSLKARHAGITTEEALAALQREGAAAAINGGEQDGAGCAGVAAAIDGDELPEEDKLAMQQFLHQQNTILKRLDSDDDSEHEEGALHSRSQKEPTKRNGKLAAVGPGPGSTAELAVPTKPGGVAKPVVKVAVRAKRPALAGAAAGGAASTALDHSKRLKRDGEATTLQQQQHVESIPTNAGTAGLMGLIGGYGSSSGSEDTV